MADLSEEDVFSNDIDPMDAIREIRKSEGVPEEDLPVSDTDTSSQKDTETVDDGSDELDEFLDTEEKEEKPSEENNEASEEEEADDTEETSDEDTDDSTEKDQNDQDDQEFAKVVRKFNANGQEFEFTQQEMLDQFEVIFGQAMDYTRKTQKIAPYRKMVSALEEEGITSEQLNTAIDALKGNKKAIQQLIKNNNIDAYDLSGDDSDEDSPYNPTDYGKNDVELGIEEVTSVISKDPEYAITVNVIDEQWDQKSRQALSNNPNMIRGLHNDIKSGVYDKVAPAAMKLKVLDGNTKSDIEYYMLAGEQVLSAEKQDSDNTEQSVSEMNKDAQDVEDNFDRASSEARRKRSAKSTRTRADRKGVIDYLDDDDENFNAWYKDLMAKN